MNCKPNDLAVVIRPFAFADREGHPVVSNPSGLGMIVRVLDWYDREGTPCWNIEKDILVMFLWKDTRRPVFSVVNGRLGQAGFVVNGIDDANLRPLPGESDVAAFDMQADRPAWKSSGPSVIRRFGNVTVRFPVKEKMP
jgi:hypothetical protein